MSQIPATPSRTPRRRTALLAGAMAVLLAVGGMPGLVARAGVADTAVESGPAASAAARPFRLNLAGPRDYVAQANFVQCVGASLQMMLNIALPRRDRSQRTQRRLQALARAWSGPRPPGWGQRQGASVRGWAAGLVILDAGPYRVAGAGSLQGAMRMAARAIRETGRPVGLLVWRGRHAWVMSGFEATGDPIHDRDFRVTRAYILDPLYPHGSSLWGPSPKPGSAVSVATVGRQFVRRLTGGPWNALPGAAQLAGKYVLVLPYGPVRGGMQ